jgi:hypothetical protein
LYQPLGGLRLPSGLLRLRRRRLVLDAGGIGPEELEGVVIAGLSIEGVHDNVTQVQQDPFAVFDTFPAQWPSLHGLFEHPFYLGCQGLDLARRSTGRDHEDVGDDEQVRNIQEDNIKTLLVADCGRGG